MFSTGNIILEFRGPWGVPVQIGSSIWLLAIAFLFGATSPYEMFYSVVFFILVMGSIYLHELGHAWGCLVQGIPVRRVVLYGGGGFCEHTRSASRRQSELIVAMGPIVNLTIWSVASLIAPAIDQPEAYWLVSSLANINLFLAILNLLPAQPLDGGRLMHLALLRILSPRAATAIAGAVGLVISILWLPAMLFSFAFFGLILIFIPSIAFHWHMVRQAITA